MTYVNRTALPLPYDPLDRASTMSIFANRRASRTTALVVLLAWLFALASGVANACLLEARGTHAHDAQTAAVSAGHAGAVASHVDDANAKESCLKVCSDSAQSPTRPDREVAPADIGLASVVAVLWNPTAPLAAAPQRVPDDPLPVTGPPIRVRFSRLAL